MTNKDFFKQVLTDEKKLLPLAKVKQVNVPFYDELSVKKFYPIMCGDDNFMQYMPDATPENRLPERTFFWNVANTLDRPYVRMLIQKASEKRMGANSEINEAKTIEISEEWWKKLNALPFVSKHKGNTLHLLKKHSKPVPQKRKRTSPEIFATP